MPHRDRDGTSELSRADSARSYRDSKDRDRSGDRRKRERDPNKPRKPRRIDPETGEPIKRKHRPIDPETGEKIRRRPRSIDPETGEPRRRRKERGESTPTLGMENSDISRKLGDVVPELSKTSSVPERESRPYPSLNKAFSKESVYSKEDLSKSQADLKEKSGNLYTPEHTDMGDKDRHERRGSKESLKVKMESKDRPLTPPDTEISKDGKSTVSPTTRANEIREDERRHSNASPASRVSATSDRSWFGRPKIIRDDKSKVSTKSRESRASTARRTSKPRVEIVEADEDEYASDGTHSQSGIDSNATSVAPKMNKSIPGKPPGLDTDSGQSNRESVSPRTPTAPQNIDGHDLKAFARDFRPTPSPFVQFDIPEQSESDAYDSPMPPPPPPPPMMPMGPPPKVDYLMQNGGLSRTVPKALLAVTPSYTGQPVNPARAPAPGPPEIEKVFSPFSQLLDQYETVLNKNGSVAVATGYRSVARRLLDRLESVFARELSYEGCNCIMCEQAEDNDVYHNREIGWGDVLEWTGGRRTLPVWPAFDFGAVGVNVISGHSHSNSGADGRSKSPQNIDPDIAEEFREHYLRQSKKTKAAVDKWLSSSAASTAAPPTDVDNETLTFTILTHLDPDDRPIFNALITGSSKPVGGNSRAPTPMAKLRSDFIVRTGLAIQRLYRLNAPPRDPEATIYLLKNPEMHHLLTTLSQINPSEWEILISGRFDGFLWSGAEDAFDSAAPSPAPSRGPTPANVPTRGATPGQRSGSFSRIMSPANGVQVNTFGPNFPIRNATPSHNPNSLPAEPQRFATPNSFISGMSSMPGTPFSVAGSAARHPVSNDEEAEIAVLAEVEREIYAGMEALEDAFEALHRKAEVVRTALRQRSAGLSMAAQSRRYGDSGAFARLGTPGMEGASGMRGGGWGNGMASRNGYHGAGVYGVYEGGDSEASEGEGWGAESEIAPDDSASNISSSRTRRPKRRNERRTPAPVEEEDEE